MITRTDVINAYVRKFNCKSYLEIGVQYIENNFDKIECEYKVGVDPSPLTGADRLILETSDVFFGHNNELFDIIFIDGLHESEQVERDIENALRVLSPNGTIVMHDCNPTSEEMQAVPRTQDVWTGDVWKAFVRFRSCKGLSMLVVDTDYGCGVIRRGRQLLLRPKPKQLTYDKLSKNRKEWLNLTSVEEWQSNLEL